MHGLDTYKNEEDQIKNEGARATYKFMTSIPDAQGQLTPVPSMSRVKFKLI